MLAENQRIVMRLQEAFVLAIQPTKKSPFQNSSHAMTENLEPPSMLASPQIGMRVCTKRHSSYRPTHKNGNQEWFTIFGIPSVIQWFFITAWIYVGSDS